MTEHRHEDCEHGSVSAWVTNPDVRWFACCDTCKRRRLRADYYEVYAFGENGCWWWECGQCLLNTVTAYAEKKARESKDRTLQPECRDCPCPEEEE